MPSVPRLALAFNFFYAFYNLIALGVARNKLLALEVALPASIQLGRLAMSLSTFASDSTLEVAPLGL